jgi:hypothetical protein
LQYAGDLDLWRRFAAHADLYSADVLVAGFRRQARQKTALSMSDYYEEIDSRLCVRGPVRSLRRLLGNRLLRRAARKWLRVRLAGRVVSYDVRARRWAVAG